VVWAPLVALAIPSVVIGGLTIAPMLAGSFFDGTIFVDAARHHAPAHVAEHAAHPAEMGLHGFLTAPFWLALGGVLAAWVLHWKPAIAASLSRGLSALRRLMENKYFFDWINENVIARGARLLGMGLWRGGDQALIDGALVNGSAATVGVLAGFARRLQTGYLYSYAFWMVIGLAVLVGWFLSRAL
jgi:NADH-quinone oxidoreductase subunit L